MFSPWKASDCKFSSVVSLGVFGMEDFNLCCSEVCVCVYLRGPTKMVCPVVDFMK